MDNNMAVRMVFKVLSVLIIDVVTFLLIFPFWMLLNWAVFPAALTAILLALLCLDVVVLTSSQMRAAFGVPVFASVTITTVLYYLAVMVFTGVTYLFIQPKNYLIISLLLTLVYIAVLAGLFISGTNSRRDGMRRDGERSMTRNVNMLLLALKRTLAEATAGNPEGRRAVMAAFGELEERLQASTPFGRSVKPAVTNMETQIVEKLNTIGTSASNTQADGALYELLTSQLQEAKTMIMDRERLMFV